MHLANGESPAQPTCRLDKTLSGSKALHSSRRRLQASRYAAAATVAALQAPSPLRVPAVPWWVKAMDLVARADLLPRRGELQNPRAQAMWRSTIECARRLESEVHVAARPQRRHEPLRDQGAC